jgi:peptide/nickel transport system permease protein
MMPIKPIILWTDALLFLLMAGGLASAWLIRRREYLRMPWRRVAHSGSGMISVVILAAFLGIGLLDSLHFRPLIAGNPGGGRSYSVEVLSLLDSMIMPLRQRVEKTYSAPLATHLYAKETVELPGNRQVREYPRLVYGGRHLKDPAKDKWSDITQRISGGLGLALLVWAGMAFLFLWGLAGHRKIGYGDCLREVYGGAGDVPWKTILLTVLALLLLIIPAAFLCLKYHLLGTDKVGQDVLYLSLKSIRTGLVIGTLTTLVMLPFAVLLGTMAGYFRGWVDDLIQYLYTTLNSIPSVLLIAAAVLMIQVHMDSHPEMFETVSARADLRLLFLCMILGITSWTGLCRLLRGETLKLREVEYIQAAQAFGVSQMRIITRHLLPNVMHIVMITMVMDFSGLVLAEAVLSYVGVGVDPSMISFGNMINSARLEMAREPMVWWSLASAFSFMFLLVLSANLFSDAVRDAFDPRVRTVRKPLAIFRGITPAGKDRTGP